MITIGSEKGRIPDPNYNADHQDRWGLQLWTDRVSQQPNYVFNIPCWVMLLWSLGWGTYKSTVSNFYSAEEGSLMKNCWI